MQIIPAIDIIDGKCVRLSKGDYERKTIYNQNPVEVAKQFETAGIERLHLVDLDGAKAGQVLNLKVLENIAQATKLTIDFSGGISNQMILKDVWSAGATYAAIGSLAVKQPLVFDGWISAYGADKFIIGADVNNELLAIKGWTEQTDISVFDFVQQYVDKGITKIFCTDISKDGLLQGPSTILYKSMMERIPKMELIASGGVSSIEDLQQLAAIGCTAAIVGKAFYEGRISLDALSNFEKQTSI